MSMIEGLVLQRVSYGSHAVYPILSFLPTITISTRRARVLRMPERTGH